MLPFSPLSKTEAPETSLRMSRPEAGLAMTPTVVAPGTRLFVLAIEELPDQTVHLPGGLHLRHVAHAVQDLDAGAIRRVLRVGGRDYPVLGAPDDEHRRPDPGEIRSFGLLAVRVELVGGLA